MNIRPEQIIYETDLLIVRAAGLPHVSRRDGGHIMVVPKRVVGERHELTPQEATECMWMTCVLDVAYKAGMSRQGIKIVKINYYEMGNWAWFNNPPTPRFHVHMYGRVWGTPKSQGFPEALLLPLKGDSYYEQTERLTAEDIAVIREEIEKTIQDPKFKREDWCK